MIMQFSCSDIRNTQRARTASIQWVHWTNQNTQHERRMRRHCKVFTFCNVKWNTLSIKFFKKRKSQFYVFSMEDSDSTVIDAHEIKYLHKIRKTKRQEMCLELDNKGIVFSRVDEKKIWNPAFFSYSKHFLADVFIFCLKQPKVDRKQVEHSQKKITTSSTRFR